MVRGNRKAKKAARNIQSSTGNGYVRSRRLAMSEFSVKCQQCNNKTKNPSGLCHLHENNKGSFAAQGATVSATPPPPASISEPIDAEDLEEELDEVEGFDAKIAVLHGHRHEIGGEEAEEIIAYQIPVDPSNPGGDEAAYKALAHLSAGDPEVMDGGRTVQFTNKEGDLVASVSDGNDSTYMYKKDPDWLHGHTMEARDEVIREQWPEWGQPREGENKTVDEILDSPTDGPVIVTAVSLVDDATWNSLDKYFQRTVQRHGVDEDELRDKAFDRAVAARSSVGGKKG